jgi:hypothetical protein
MAYDDTVMTEPELTPENMPASKVADTIIDGLNFGDMPADVAAKRKAIFEAGGSSRTWIPTQAIADTIARMYHASNAIDTIFDGLYFGHITAKDAADWKACPIRLNMSQADVDKIIRMQIKHEADLQREREREEKYGKRERNEDLEWEMLAEDLPISGAQLRDLA